MQKIDEDRRRLLDEAFEAGGFVSLNMLDGLHSEYLKKRFAEPKRLKASADSLTVPDYAAIFKDSVEYAERLAKFDKVQYGEEGYQVNAFIDYVNITYFEYEIEGAEVLCRAALFGSFVRQSSAISLCITVMDGGKAVHEEFLKCDGKGFNFVHEFRFSLHKAPDFGTRTIKVALDVINIRKHYIADSGALRFAPLMSSCVAVFYAAAKNSDFITNVTPVHPIRGQRVFNGDTDKYVNESTETGGTNRINVFYARMDDAVKAHYRYSVNQKNSSVNVMLHVELVTACKSDCELLGIDGGYSLTLHFKESGEPHYKTIRHAGEQTKVLTEITNNKKQMRITFQKDWKSTLLQIKQVFDYAEINFRMNVRLKKSDNTVEVTPILISSFDDAKTGGPNFKSPGLYFRWGCVAKDSEIRLFNGETKKIQHIRKGDELTNHKNEKMIVRRIISSAEREKVLRFIKTEGGHELYATKSHAVMTSGGFALAGEITTDAYVYCGDHWERVTESSDMDADTDVYDLALDDKEEGCYYAGGICVKAI